MKISGLENEWLLLQNQFDSYEKYSLLIKLANVGVLSAAYFLNRESIWLAFLLLILWGQDAVWKTFQSRIETRLLQVEAYLFNGTDEKACQFNSQYQKNRLGGVSLIAEYCRQAFRPTVAYPHVVLLTMLMFESMFKVVY